MALKFLPHSHMLVHPDEEGRFFDLFFIALLVMVVVSQLFWIRRVLDLAERLTTGKPRRAWLAVLSGLIYLFFFIYSFTHLGVIHQATMGHIAGPADPRLYSILMEGVFTWWLVGSWLGFCLVIIFWTIDHVARTQSGSIIARARLPQLTPPLPSLLPSLFSRPPAAASSSRPPSRYAPHPSWPLLTGCFTVGLTWKSPADTSDWPACPKPLRAFASHSFPTSTSAPSCLRTRFAVASRSPTR
jgi:hypothetical protein